MLWIVLLLLLSIGGFPAKALDSVADTNETLPNPLGDSNAALLLEIFFESIQSFLDHIIKSRDLHKQFALIQFLPQMARQKRQVNNNNFGSNILSQFSGGALGQQPSGFSQGLSAMDNVVKAVTSFDRFRCVNRMLCEMAAQRLFNNTNNRTLIDNPGTFSLSEPSNLRSVLGILQLFQMHRYATYPFVEAALWGSSHRDTSRCRSQFSTCPSSSEAFITQLNNHPGGLQGVITSAVESIRPSTPATSAVVAQTPGLSSGVSSSAGGIASTAANTAASGIGGGFLDATNNFFQFNNPAFGGGLNPSTFQQTQSFPNPGVATNPLLGGPGAAFNPAAFGPTGAAFNPAASFVPQLAGFPAGSAFGSPQTFDSNAIAAASNLSPATAVNPPQTFDPNIAFSNGANFHPGTVFNPALGLPPGFNFQPAAAFNPAQTFDPNVFASTGGFPPGTTFSQTTGFDPNVFASTGGIIPGTAISQTTGFDPNTSFNSATQFPQGSFQTGFTPGHFPTVQQSFAHPGTNFLSKRTSGVNGEHSQSWKWPTNIS